MSTNNEAGERMTLPKAISDAIDAYNDALLSGAGSPVDFDCNDSRAAHDRASRNHVAPVAAPTEAEIEALASEATEIAGHCGVARDLVLRLRDTTVALMRRAAAATPAPSALERLRERANAVAECRDDMGRYIWDEQTRDAMHRVLDWIDEEREREAKR